MAGGFAAGFGTAFADSFNTAYENRKAQEHDTFQSYYKSYLDGQEKDKEWKRKQAQLVESSKALVAGSNAPPEAWTWVYGQLNAGASADKINEMMANGTFQVSATQAKSDTSGTATPDGDLTKNAETSVGAQMTQSGMQPPANGGIFGNMNANRTNKFNDKIAKLQGVDPDSVAKSMSTDNIQSEALPTMDGKSVKYIPGPSVKVSDINDLESAEAVLFQAQQRGDAKTIALVEGLIPRLKAIREEKKIADMQVAGTYVAEDVGAIRGDKPGSWNGLADKGPDGQWYNRETGELVDAAQVKGYGKQQVDAFRDLADKTKEPREKFEASRQNLVNMAKTTSSMYDLAKEVPEGLDLSGEVSMTVDRYLKGGKNLLNILTGSGPTFINKDGSIDTSAATQGFKALSDAEAKLEKNINAVGRNERVALAATLIRIKQQKLAYMYGMAMGQEGRSLDQREQERFMQSAAGNGRLDAILATAADYTREAYDNTVAMQKSITREGELAMAPVGNIPLPQPLAEDVDVYLGREDPALAGKIKEYREFNPLDAISNETPEQTQNGVEPKPESKEVDDILNQRGLSWEQLTPRAREILTKKYGGQ